MDVRNRRGQKGSALVVITLLVLLSSVLGLALLSTTLTSHQSVLNSENSTKAKYLAEYGVTIGLEDLQKKLDEFNKGNISDWDWMLSKIDELRNFRGNGIPDSMQMKERYEYSLKLNDQPDVNNQALGQYVISGYLEATGEANGKKVKFRAPVQISNIADVFNFALAAKNNIYLNGGVEIHGSLYAGEKLVVHKIAHFKHGSQYNFTSVYPEIHGKISAGPLNANIHHIYHIGTHENDSDEVGKHKITGNPVPIDQLSEQGYLVGNYKVAKVPAITFPELNMNEIKEEIKKKAGFSESQLRDSGKTFYHQNDSGVDYYYITGAARDCLKIKKQSRCDRWYEKSTTYRIGQNNGNKGPFKGVYYINGDLVIRGDVRLEGTFYVNGKVSMQYTKRTENPIAAAIIAQGEIEIANNNLYNDQPAILNAFFWSLADDFVIYGVGSNLKINGGVIAKNIVLNGVRGKTYEGSKLTFNPNPQRYEQNGKKVPSRLTIVYDEQFITHPPAGVPTNEGFKLSQIGQWEYVEE